MCKYTQRVTHMQIYQSDKQKPAPLNALMIARLKGNGEDQWIRQGEQTGLYIRVRPSGEKYFAVRMKLPGDSRIVVSTLGPCDGPAALTLREAKLAAAGKLSARSKAGVNVDVKEAMAQFFAEHVEP
ncbi:MAG TPA: Arm DNA-binding domain-containing protein, partial [Casimicrobiaceae bacterium]